MYASDFRRIARERLAGNWAVSVGAALIATLLGAVLLGNNQTFTLSISPRIMEQLPLRISAFAALLALVRFILTGVIRQGYCQFLLDQYDGRELRVKTLFSQFHRFGDGFVLFLLESIYVTLWLFVFIIPGIIAAYSYAMAPYIMQEHPDMRPSEAIRASKAMMDGNKWRLFCLHFSFIGWDLLNLLTLGIGSLWLNPYQNAAVTAFYREISKETV